MSGTSLSALRGRLSVSYRAQGGRIELSCRLSDHFSRMQRLNQSQPLRCRGCEIVAEAQDEGY